MKSASLVKLRRNSMEFRSDVDISEVVEVAVVIPGLEAAGDISEHILPFALNTLEAGNKLEERS